VKDDLISRQAAIDTLAEWNDAAINNRLNNLPSVDAVPVRHGRWIYHIDDLFPAESTKKCDQCHEEQPLTCDDNFCPHCGAKMDATLTKEEEK
jgi:hypothetical protein